ncbi:hypothetical protein RAS2_29030 [Phycisphaerae bacterium RAS2]|nr:hypothetical protein RAS2_29030 [Phycisphaerae bacterium RAS2]
MRLYTTRGYDFFEVASALQKSIRRGDAKLAGYWAIELFESGYSGYLWRRLLTISAEDCWGILTQEVESLFRGWETIDKQGRAGGKRGKGRIFAAKAVILLAMAKKSRDPDHLTNLVYDPKSIPDEVLESELDAARSEAGTIPIPDEALDYHTKRGRKSGKTKQQFFHDEHNALKPREPGLFDDLVPPSNP